MFGSGRDHRTFFLMNGKIILSLNDLLDNRKQRILNTIRNSEELREGAIQQLEKRDASDSYRDDAIELEL
jgi:cytidylate kinase